MKTIPVSEPAIGPEEIEYVNLALKKGDISGFKGEFISRFESEFSKYSNCNYGVTTSSGTAALHVAMLSLDIAPGDEVLVSTYTNMATFFSVLYQGARPIPIDVLPDTWNINPKSIEEKISKKTKAILVVHIFGHPVDMDPVLEIARKHGLFVVEDCAEAHGATYNDKKVGSIGDIGCFSFYANKIITTGEGGMIVTRDGKIAERARSLKSLAFGEQNKFMHREIGYNYRMTNLQAAIGCAQLGKIDEIISRKREVARKYSELLGDLDYLELPIEKPYAKNVYWMYHVVLKNDPPMDRAEIMDALSKKGIETRPGFIPFNMQEIFISKGLTAYSECPVANNLALNSFYLPSGPSLTPEQVEFVADSLKDLLTK